MTARNTVEQYEENVTEDDGVWLLKHQLQDPKYQTGFLRYEVRSRACAQIYEYFPTIVLGWMI